MMISHEVFSFGFPLACDFLKELGWDQYPKPDVHIKAVVTGLGLPGKSDYQVFKTIVLLAALAKHSPFDLDRVIWMCCSGKSAVSAARFPTNRDAYIRQLAQRLKLSGNCLGGDRSVI